MKRIFTLLFVAVLALTVASCNKYKYETVKDDPTQARIYTLDNGLKVYMIVNKDEPRIDAHVAVKVGSKNDPQETTGLAHPPIPNSAKPSITRSTPFRMKPPRSSSPTSTTRRWQPSAAAAPMPTPATT